MTIITLYSHCTRVLTFQNLCQEDATDYAARVVRLQSGGCSGDGGGGGKEGSVEGAGMSTSAGMVRCSALECAIALGLLAEPHMVPFFKIALDVDLYYSTWYMR